MSLDSNILYLCLSDRVSCLFLCLRLSSLLGSPQENTAGLRFVRPIISLSLLFFPALLFHIFLTHCAAMLIYCCKFKKKRNILPVVSLQNLKDCFPSVPLTLFLLCYISAENTTWCVYYREQETSFNRVKGLAITWLGTHL